MPRFRIFKKTAACCLILILALSLFASCRKSSVMALYFAVNPGRGSSFDPQIVQEGATTVAVLNCFEGLVCLDENGTVQPGVAEAWDVSPDGLTYTFRLRPDAKWHLTSTAAEAMEEKLDGFSDAVTAYDFVFALRRAVDPATGAPEAGLLQNIKDKKSILEGAASPKTLGVHAPDAGRLTIRLASPQSDFFEVLTRPVCMPCNQAFFEATGGRYGRYIKYMLSNGPFFMTRFDLEEGAYRLAKNPEYAGANAAKADVIWLYHRPDDDALFEGLKNGDYSGAAVDPLFFEGRDLRRFLTVGPADTVRVFLLNAAGPVAECEDYRFAFTSAVTMDELTRALDRTPAVSVLPDAFSAFASAAPAAPDYTAAKEALSRGLKARGDDTAEITILCEPPYENAVRRLMQEYQKVFGFQFAVSVSVVDTADLKARVAVGNYDAALYPLQAPCFGLSRYFERIAALTGFSDPDFDAAVEALRYSASESPAAVKALTETVLDRSLVLPLWQEGATVLTQKTVSGVTVLPGMDRIYFHNAEIG